MKKLLGLLIICLGVSGLLRGQNNTVVIDRVIALVGGELVLLSELEEQYAYIKANNPGIEEDAKCGILDQLLANKLLLNQSKIDSIEVSDEEVEGQLNARIDQILAYMNNDMSQFEEYYGQSINQVKTQIRDDLKSQLLIDRMRNKILTEVQVTPSEVKDFFNKIPSDSLPYFNSEVEVGEIVVKPVINQDEKKRAEDLLKSIRERIVNGGEDFAALAQKFSDDNSGRMGGDLGWTKRGNFVPEFEAAAYKLDVMEVSPVIESKFGFHLIQMLGRRGNSINTRHILIKPVITQADIDSTKIKLEEIRTLIESDSISFSEGVKRFSDEDQQSTNNDGRMINPITGNTFFEIGDLDPDIYFTIDTLQVGDISGPLEFKDPRGEPLLRIIQLQSITDPHKASLSQDYSKIRQAAIDSKKAEHINGYVAEKVDATYVKIIPTYATCTSLYKWTKEYVKP